MDWDFPENPQAQNFVNLEKSYKIYFLFKKFLRMVFHHVVSCLLSKALMEKAFTSLRKYFKKPKWRATSRLKH